jgi:hypothetical protein
MFVLNDAQLATVMTTADALSVEKRMTFIERIAARLRLCGSRFTDADFDNAIRIALQGLIHNSVA